MARWFNADFFRYMGLILLPKYVLPDEIRTSIAEIDPTALQRKGIQAVIFDIDQTLTRHHEPKLHESIEESFQRIKSRMKVCAISNYAGIRADDRQGHQADAVERVLGVKVIRGEKKKPSPELYVKALAYLQSKPRETAMVGDRIFTDVLGAKRLNLYTVLVHPLDPTGDPWYIKGIRHLEMAWMKGLQLFLQSRREVIQYLTRWIG
jgi:hypothetical protein